MLLPENVILKNLIRHLVVQREEAVIIDMEAVWSTSEGEARDPLMP